MALTVAEFWRLAEKAQLLNQQQCQQFNYEFRSQFQPPEANNPVKMAEWLVQKNVFSNYQTAVLLAGHAGPFVYGDYKIYDRLENGRLANWFRAVHVHTGHPVLLHFLSGSVVQDARLWTIAATEVQLACSLLHPHVQRYFEVVDLGSFKFVVTEDLRGVTLEERLTSGRINPMEACRTARGMALGLAALHAAGRPHGDVRPANVWLDQSVPNYPETVKLLRDAWSPPMTPNFLAEDPQGKLLGQCDYLAPEFQMPGKPHDALTDIYSLGCTLYHMLSGQPPFPGGSVTQKLSRHAMEAIQPLENYGIPQPVGQVVMYLMAKNPSVRYQDAQSVADQLAAFIDPQWLHAQIPSAYPTLPAYEASLKQTQAKLIAQQQAAVASSEAAATPRGEALPTGKVSTSGSSTAPPVVVATPGIAPGKAAVNPKEYAAIKEEREKKKLIIMLGSIGAALILIIILVNSLGKGGGDNTEIVDNQANTTAETKVAPPPDLEELKGVVSTDVTPPAKTKDKSEPKEKKSEANPEAPAMEIVEDDGALLWASPTTGKPVELKYVPPLAGLFVVLRPAEMIASPEGARVLHALGPTVQTKISDWEKGAGVKLEEVEKLIFAMHDNESQFPGVSLVAHMKEPLAPETWLSKWGNPAEKKDGEHTYYVNGAGWACYLPTAENGKVVVMASEYLFKDALGSPFALLKQEMSQLRLKSDDTRHVNILFNPSFLFSGSGDPLFATELKRVREPLTWLLGEGLQAGSLSMNFSDTFYLEMRFITKVDKEPYKLADEFRTRLAQVPENLTNYFAEQLNPPVYWKKFAFKYPSMIEKLHEAMRVGVEDKQAVVNVVLPNTAAHNLVLGSELTIATAPSAMQVATTTNAPGAASYKSLEEVMEKVVIKNFSFAQQSLERSVELLEEEIKTAASGVPFEVTLRILGTDLQIDGITRNQSVRDFMQENKTAAEVLTAIVRKANPITTVKEPSELDQKLIWIVAEDPDSGKMSVLVTTRAAAEKRKNKLPAVFMPK